MSPRSIQEIVMEQCLTAEHQTKAVAYIETLKCSKFQLDVKFLMGVLRILKRFSTSFQVSSLRLYEYVNLQQQLKRTVQQLIMGAPTLGSHYYFPEYQEIVDIPLLDPQMTRPTRANPGTDMSGLNADLAARVKLHDKFLDTLSELLETYWFQHQYWDRNQLSVTAIQNIGQFLNGVVLAHSVSGKVADPVAPLHRMCDKCPQVALPADEAKHRCAAGRKFIDIPTLNPNFKPDTQITSLAF